MSVKSAGIFASAKCDTIKWDSDAFADASAEVCFSYTGRSFKYDNFSFAVDVGHAFHDFKDDFFFGFLHSVDFIIKFGFHL